MRNEEVDIQPTHVWGETEKAIKLDFDGEAVWLPKSLADVHHNADTGKTVITVPYWWVDEHGLDEHVV